MVYDVWIITNNPSIEYSESHYDLIGEHKGGRYEIARLSQSMRENNITSKVINLKKLEVNNIITYDGIKIPKPKLVLIRETDHNFKKIELLEQQNVRCINTTESHILCARKYQQLYMLCGIANFPASWKTRIPFDDGDLLKEVLRVIGLPMVVKPASSQRGELVTLCSSIDELYSHAKKVLMSNKNDIILQQYINGPTIVCWVVGSEILSAQIRAPKDPDTFFVSNHKDLGIRENYKINDELKSLVLKSTKRLGVEIAKVDVLKSKNGYMICEVNSPGGFFGRDEYFMTNHANDIAKYVKKILS
jgi:glutathione synthase/RimK-type ligase-like ATP-grasp enzyme